jgi:hypothetical protein
LYIYQEDKNRSSFKVQTIMKNSVIISLSLLILVSCGYSTSERKAADFTCDCSEDKSVFGIAECMTIAADSFGIDKASLGYDRAIKENCPELYQRMMDFTKGK